LVTAIVYPTSPARSNFRIRVEVPDGVEPIKAMTDEMARLYPEVRHFCLDHIAWLVERQETT